MIDAEQFVVELDDKEEHKNFKLATVVDLFINDTAKLQFDGEDTPSEKEYAYLDSYTPMVDDRVLLGVLGGTYVILGKVNYNEAPSSGGDVADRYLFDLKAVTILKGMEVSGAVTFNEGVSVVGDIGTTGNITAVAINASGTITGANLSTAGTVGGSTATFSSLTVNGASALKGNTAVTGTLSASSTLTASGQFAHKGAGLGFFNKTPRAIIQVVKYIPSPLGTEANPTLVNNKLNELITALQNYGLIY